MPWIKLFEAAIAFWLASTWSQFPAPSSQAPSRATWTSAIDAASQTALTAEAEAYLKDSGSAYGPEHGGDFYCAYPAQLTFGFHTPKRIDAGLRWCFGCGAWQPCDCPRSTAIAELRSLNDGELTGNGFGNLQDELARLRVELDALRDAREKMVYGVRANSPAATRDRIVSAFGILIPDSAGWPTLLRYFAKPLPEASLPNTGGDDLTVPSASGDSP